MVSKHCHELSLVLFYYLYNIVPPGFYYRQVADTALGDSSQSILICEFLTVSPTIHMSIPTTLINSTQITYISSSDCTDPSNIAVWEQTFAGVVVAAPSVSVSLCMCEPT